MTLATRDGPKVFECSAFDRLKSVLLHDVNPLPTLLHDGEPAGSTGIYLTYQLTTADLYGYVGDMFFFVMSNGDYWKHRDRILALPSGDAESDDD